jgi:hypothetical protein
MFAALATVSGMTLQEIADSHRAIPILTIGGDVPLASQVQDRLAAFGLLDPPSDGRFGPVSQWALGEFLKRAGLAAKTALDGDVARALLDLDAAALCPLKRPRTLAGRLVGALLAKKFWVCRHPEAVNIVYVEGMDVDGKSNPNVPNEFNDSRFAIRITRTGNPSIDGSWEATTEPGRQFTSGPGTHPDGAARIAFGQYKSWSVGIHRRGAKTAHEALVQTAPIDIFRDLNRDFSRAGDRKFSGLFGINQHAGLDVPKADIRKASAGCLVGRTSAGHREFLKLCKSDPRFTSNNGYRFVTTVLPAAEI